MAKSHLKECLGPWCPGLEHDGQDGEDDDLDGGATSIPIRTADTILKNIFIVIKDLQIEMKESLRIEF